MGAGTRENQYKKRFGLGKPIDTYGIQCIHTKPVSPGTKATAPKATFDWELILEDPSVAKKISSESWVRSFVKENMDYGKLNQIGEGETEILGLKIDMEKGIVQYGDPDSFGKSYFDLKLVDTGSTIRIYEDNKISIWYKGDFRRLKIEQLEVDGTFTEPLEIDAGKGPGADLTTILMGDYLEKIGFFDEFVVGKETDKVFGVKGTVKEVSSDGHYVTIEYTADTGRGSGIKEVRISPKGATVNDHPIMDVVTRGDGAVYLRYERSDGVFKTPIKLPDTTVTVINQGKRVDVDYLSTGFNYNDIQRRTGATNLLGDLNIKGSTDYTERVAYAAFGGNRKVFDAIYGDGKWDALLKIADIFSESVAKEALGNMGLYIKEVEVERGVRPEGGNDIRITTKDEKTIILDVEYTKDDLPKAKWTMAQKFAKNKADLGMIFYKGRYYVCINSATEYEPLANIARDIEHAGKNKIV